MPEPPGIRTRTRTVESDISNAAAYTNVSYHGYYGTSNSTTNTGPNKVWVSTDSMTDVVTPHFKRLMKNGIIVNNDMTSIRVVNKLDLHPITFSRSYSYTDYLANGTETTTGQIMPTDWLLANQQTDPFFGLSLPNVDNEIESAKDAALTETYATVANSNFMAVAAIAEAKKSARMLVDHFRKATELVRRLRNLQRGAGRLSVKKLDQEWLSIRYGLRPSMYDIQNIIDAWAGVGKPQRLRFVAYRKVEGNYTSNFTYQTDRIDYKLRGCKHDVDYSASVSALVSAGILVQMKHSNVTWQKSFGLTIDQLLPQLWELVPYSFVLDWFINVGDFIISWAPKEESSVLTSWDKVDKTITQTLHRSNWRIQDNWPVASEHPQGWSGTRTGHTLDATGGDMERITVSTTRVARPDKPILPTMDIHLSVEKLVDLVLLLRQLR